MTKHQCPVCDSDDLVSFLHRSGVPVHQNLVVASQDAARTVTRGDLDLLACTACGFVFNVAFDLSRLAYGEDYDNTQSYSAYFDNYLDGLVKDLVERQGVRNCTIVEVGCGKGHFLRKLVSYPGANNKGIGIDPSYVGPDTDLHGKLSFRRSYYDQSCTDVAADVVVCRHVIEHVPEPMLLLHAVRAALTNAPKARVFFETPCVEWVLRNRVIWDLFYEHCSLFTASSLRLAFQRADFAVQRVEHIFGGQYLWLEASPTKNGATPTPQPGEIGALALAYGADEARLCATWLATLNTLKGRGKVAVWGAGAKGATFVNLVDPHCELIDCVTDVNPRKHGGFIPGTGHPIVPLHELPLRGVKYAGLTNPNYREECQRLLATAHIELDLIDWSEP